MNAAIAAFLLAFPALFSIVNAPGGAFIFNEVTAHLSHRDRARIAGKVAAYSLGVMLGALWFGAYVLNFFGISLAALRLAGGVVVAVHAWALLSAPERQEALAPIYRVHSDYLEAMFDAVEASDGSVQAFLTGAVALQPSELERLREMLLA